MNGDGVIDTKEFSRWYLTGMKSYNDSTRRLLQIKGHADSVFDILFKNELV